MPELSPEMRKQKAKNEGIEAIRNDSMPAKEQGPLDAGPAAEYAGESQRELLADLNANYEDAVKEVMMLSGLSTDNEVGKAFYEAAMRDQEAYVQAAFNKVMLEKLPLDQAQDVLEKLLSASKAN